MNKLALGHPSQTLDPNFLDAKHRIIGANTPILLDRLDKALFVLEGHVDVFAVQIKDGLPIGQRHTLFRATTGDLLFGMPVSAISDHQNAFALLAVGVAGTEILDDISLSSCQSLGTEDFGAFLDRFIEQLFSCFVQQRPVGRATQLDTDAKSELYKNMSAITTSGHPLWISTETEDAHLKLNSDDRFTGRIFPITSNVWVTASSTLTATTQRSKEFVARPDFMSALSAFMQVYNQHLSITIADAQSAILKRHKNDQNTNETTLKNALQHMATTVRTDYQPHTNNTGVNSPLHAAFLAVAQHLNVESAQTPHKPTSVLTSNCVNDLALTYRIRIRRVVLNTGWMSQDVGPLLCYLEDSRDPVALLPLPSGGYEIYNPKTQHRTLCDDKTENTLHGEAVMLYPPLPSTSRRLKDLVNFILPSIKGDLRQLALMGLAGGLIAAFTPFMTRVLIESVLPRADISQHIQIILALIVAALGAGSFEVVKAIALLRAEGRADLHLQAALFDRLLRLPAGFYRRYTAGDLTDRVLGIHTIRQTLTGSTVQGLLGMTFSIFSLMLLFYYNWKLAFIALLLVIFSAMLTTWISLKQLVEERQRIAHQGTAEGFVIQLLTGIAKLRVAGAENRAFARWAHYFTEQKKRFVRAQTFGNLQDIFQSVFPVIATGLIFIAASVLLKDASIQWQLTSLVDPTSPPDKPTMSSGEFIAFNVAFGQFLAAMTALVTSLSKGLTVIPLFERLLPIMAAVPEIENINKSTDELRGAIEINHVSFRYEKESPLVLDNVSLSIEPNEFVAVVGASGSGKSTLVRLLLGFERASSGEILYDSTPLSSMDMATVRQQVKVVIQNGHLTSGSVLTNIIGNSGLTIDEAWHAARLAGLDKDIEALPMGMHTVLMEGVNTLSGGQRQRLMIARALVHRPRILLLDEPTSALDNTSQDVVMTSLKHLNATRVVIAHRLSTIRSADRVFVMERGCIVQQGTYEQLIATPGPFADLAKRQLV